MTAPVRYHALVLAGSRGPVDPVARAAGRSHKALAPIAGRPMLERVIASMRACPSIASVAVAIEADTTLPDTEMLAALFDSGAVQRAPCAASPARTVLAALSAQADALPMLVVTADHPLLSVEMVEHFLRGARSDADAAVGLAPADLVRRRFPHSRRTLLRFADGARCGCNLFAFNTPAAAAVVRFWAEVEQHRKRPWRLVRAFGIGSLIRYLTGRLGCDAAFARASRVFGATVRAVDMPFAEAAVDVDSEADFALVEAVLRARERDEQAP